MTPHEAAALEAMSDEYGASVAYTGAGLSGDDVWAVRSDFPAALLEGFDGKRRKVTFEIPVAALPDRPKKGNQIVEADETVWNVNDVNERPDIGRWVLSVERAPL